MLTAIIKYPEEPTLEAWKFEVNPDTVVEDLIQLAFDHFDIHDDREYSLQIQMEDDDSGESVWEPVNEDDTVSQAAGPNGLFHFQLVLSA